MKLSHTLRVTSAVFDDPTLLCLSSRGLLPVKGVEVPVELTCEVALKAPSDLPVGEALGSSLLYVGTGSGMVNHSSDRCHVQGAVESSVTATVEPMPARVAG